MHMMQGKEVQASDIVSTDDRDEDVRLPEPAVGVQPVPSNQSALGNQPPGIVHASRGILGDTASWAQQIPGDEIQEDWSD